MAEKAIESTYKHVLENFCGKTFISRWGREVTIQDEIVLLVKSSDIQHRNEAIENLRRIRLAWYEMVEVIFCEILKGYLHVRAIVA